MGLICVLLVRELPEASGEIMSRPQFFTLGCRDST